MLPPLPSTHSCAGNNSIPSSQPEWLCRIVKTLLSDILHYFTQNRSSLAILLWRRELELFACLLYSLRGIVYSYINIVCCLVSFFLKNAFLRSVCCGFSNCKRWYLSAGTLFYLTHVVCHFLAARITCTLHPLSSPPTGALK